MKINTQKVKHLMERRKLDTSELARITGVHRQSIYDMLAGRTGKTFRIVSRLAKALGVTERDIIN